MGKLIDLTGKQFGRLTVIERVDTNATNVGARWLCKCSCGNQKIIKSASLVTGKTKSCNCIRDEKAAKRMTTHGKSKTLLYEIWQSIKQRTGNENNKDYKNYGGRGIFMAEEWKNDFIAFEEWALKSGYEKHLTIERIDVNKGYFPENCTWIKNELQWINKRNTNLYFYKGEVKDIRYFSEKYNINYNTLRSRINNHKWPIEKAIETEVKNSGAKGLSNKKHTKTER